jgi:hypothetical protein
MMTCFQNARASSNLNATAATVAMLQQMSIAPPIRFDCFTLPLHFFGIQTNTIRKTVDYMKAAAGISGDENICRAKLPPLLYDIENVDKTNPDGVVGLDTKAR